MIFPGGFSKKTPLEKKVKEMDKLLVELYRLVKFPPCYQVYACYNVKIIVRKDVNIISFLKC
jgi:hypothetical protein